MAGLGTQIGVRSDLTLPHQRGADLQVERQPEDLDRNATIGNTRLKRDRDLRQRTADRAERVVSPPVREPVPLGTAELAGDLRWHGKILPQPADSPASTRVPSRRNQRSRSPGLAT